MNIPLTLETATPSYGVQIPDLKSLKLSVKMSQRRPTYMPQAYAPQMQTVPTTMPGPTVIMTPPSQQVFVSRYSHARSRSPVRGRRSPSFSRSRSSDRGRRRSPSIYRSRSPARIMYRRTPKLATLGLKVTSKSDGRFNHSVFQVPGLISVPCDGMVHNVTIIELNKELDTKLLWFSVPKVDTRVHLKVLTLHLHIQLFFKAFIGQNQEFV